MRKYRRILFQNCVIEMFYAVMSGISQTEVETYNDVMVNVVMGIPNATRSEANIVTAIWMFSLYALILFVPTPFVYRYLVIVRRVIVTWKIYIIIFIPTTLNVFLLTIGNYFAMSSAPACSEEILRLMKANHHGMNLACQPVMPSHLGIKLCLIASFVSIIPCAIVIPTLNYLTFRYLRKEASMSSSELMVHGQFSKTMMLQFSHYILTKYNI
uniref:G protein-coupled receptor n=1 Tax=Panagrellus redivivus TaxID=6233 RepID=A0A7E4VNS2_PANRE